MTNTPLVKVSAPVHKLKMEKPAESMIPEPQHGNGITDSPMKTTTQARTHERILVLLEQPPWSALYRMGVGIVMVPLFSRLSGGDASGWWFVVWFVGTLFALRLIPAVLRKILPFSSSTKALWYKRRQDAKRYDSYQWTKLFWIGIGLAGYVLVWGEPSSIGGAVAIFCIVSGGLGYIFRVGRATKMTLAEVATRKGGCA